VLVRSGHPDWAALAVRPTHGAHCQRGPVRVARAHQHDRGIEPFGCVAERDDVEPDRRGVHAGFLAEGEAKQDMARLVAERGNIDATKE